MGSYFFDTSAIVKGYVPEQGRSFILTLCNPAEGHDLYISQATLVEAVASIYRKAHVQNITVAFHCPLVVKVLMTFLMPMAQLFS